jgi:hypothetical protein
MSNVKNLSIVVSLALSLSLCKPVLADDTDSKRWLEGFHFGGFASAGITAHRDAETEAAINQISLITTWNGDSRWQFFSEFELERPLAWHDDQQFSRKESHIDLERLYFDYNISAQSNLRLGRFLTPNSRWNLLRAPPLLWTSSRPLATSRLFPEGTNGLMLHGALPLNNGALEYQLFGEVLEDQEDDGDFELQFEHVKGARFSYKNQSEIGVSLLCFREKDIKNGSYRMLGLDFVTHISDTEISGEAFQRINNQDKDGGSGAYLQTAVPLNKVGLQEWYWITRLETLQRPKEASYERWLLGATWRLKPTQLLKLEFIGGSGDLPESPRGFTASFAILF